MSLFTQLRKLGIDIDQIANLTDESLIRVEKKLKAEARMGGDIDINEIESILDVLKNHKRELAILHREDFNILRTILENPSRFFVLYNKVELPDNDEIEALRDFLRSYFQNELTEYIRNCISKGYYNALYSLLIYNFALPSSLLDDAQTKLRSKLDYAIECISISSSNLSDKVNHCTNPFFFRSISQIGSNYFERDVIRLTNVTLDKLKTSQLQLRLLFALGSFTALSEELKETLHSNWSYARRRGVTEVPEDPLTGKKTGGTSYSSKAPASKPSGSGSGSGSVKKTARKKKDRKLIYLFIGIVVVGIYLVRQRMNSFYDPWDDYDYLETIPDYEEEAWDEFLEEVEIMEEEAPMIEEMEEGPSLKDMVNEVYYGDPKIISRKNIAFDTEETGLFGISENAKSSDRVRLVNNTGKHILLSVKGAFWEKHELLAPGESVRTSTTARGVRVYMGEEPQVVTYISENGDTLTTFYFGDCSDYEIDVYNEFCNLREHFYAGTDYQVSVVIEDSFYVETYVNENGYNF